MFQVDDGRSCFGRMEANLESKEECRVSLNSLYDYFGEACSFDGTAVVDQPMFNKVGISDAAGKQMVTAWFHLSL